MVKVNKIHLLRATAEIVVPKISKIVTAFLKVWTRDGFSCFDALV